jgi:checkpoint serine/threonine-protein kinase
MYKNDPRYLKMWLRYIKLFCDAPRETYAFLARHGIGEGLALYYEEYAAWLEAQGRWSQAEEVFATGVDKEARPKERLLRKYAEFQHRRETKTIGGDGPDSPALPRVRPALAAKLDPFAGQFDEQDPQAGDRVAAQAAGGRAGRPGRAKMTIFADGENGQAQSSGSVVGSGPGWESIGSLIERRKENTREPTSWVGEKMDGGKKAGGPKLEIFKDPVSQ